MIHQLFSLIPIVLTTNKMLYYLYFNNYFLYRGFCIKRSTVEHVLCGICHERPLILNDRFHRHERPSFAGWKRWSLKTGSSTTNTDLFLFRTVSCEGFCLKLIYFLARCTTNTSSRRSRTAPRQRTFWLGRQTSSRTRSSPSSASNAPRCWVT